MFCTSLRRRSSFVSAVAGLSKAPLGLRESQLKTHDLEVPVISGVELKTGNASSTRQLRILLFSRSAVSNEKLEETQQRVQHFASLTGGEDLLIVFLLNPPRGSSFVSAKELTKDTTDDTANEDAIAAYSKFQAELINQADVPYIPVRLILKLDELPAAIEKHISALKTEPRKQRPSTTRFELLKLCTANPRMSDQTAFILSDIFSDLDDLASACSTISSAPNSSSPSARAAALQSSQTYDLSIDMSTQSANSGAAGKLKRLRDLIGPQECQDIIDFWKEEWLLQ